MLLFIGGRRIQRMSLTDLSERKSKKEKEDGFAPGRIIVLGKWSAEALAWSWTEETLVLSENTIEIFHAPTSGAVQLDYVTYLFSRSWRYR